MAYASKIREMIAAYPEKKIIETNKLHREKFPDVPGVAFQKAISRLAQNGSIVRVSKGVYCRPAQVRFGSGVSGDQDVLDHYLGKKQDYGMVIGYQMYNEYHLTTQISKQIEVYSNQLHQEIKNVNNITIRRIHLRFSPEQKSLIQLMEVLENYRAIEDLNSVQLAKFIKSRLKFFQDSAIDEILREIRYKKKTVASLKTVLDHFNVPNRLESYLNTSSDYMTIPLELFIDIT